MFPDWMKNAFHVGIQIAPALKDIASTILTAVNNTIVTKAVKEEVLSKTFALNNKFQKILPSHLTQRNYCVKEELERIMRDNEFDFVGKIAYLMDMECRHVNRQIFHRFISPIMCHVLFGNDPKITGVHWLDETKRLIDPTILLNGPIRSTKLYPPLHLVEDQFIRLLNDALLCLSRIYPKRKIAPSSMLSIQNVRGFFFTVEKSGINEERLIEAYDMRRLYNYNSYKCGQQPPNHKGDSDWFYFCEPKIRTMNKDIFNKYFPNIGKEMSEVTIVDLLFEKQIDKVYDPNFSAPGLLNNIMGSSVTSLMTIIEFLVIFSFVIKKEHNISADFIDHFKRKTRLSSPMVFCNPDILYAEIHVNKVTQDELLLAHEIIYFGIQLMMETLFNHNIGRIELQDFLGIRNEVISIEMSSPHDYYEGLISPYTVVPSAPLYVPELSYKGK